MTVGYRIVHPFLRTALTMWVALASIACTKTSDTPPEISIDKMACSRCKMLISDGRFAAALRVNDSYLIFDDIGCMFAYAKQHTETSSSPIWVRDYSSDQWIGAEHASFFHADGDLTPMGYGYVAVTMNTKPPAGLKNLLQIGDLAALRTAISSK